MDLTGLVKQRPTTPAEAEIIETSPLKRDFDAKRINPVLNHPNVRPWLGPGTNELDFSELVANFRNVLLATDRGGLLFHCLEPGLYEIHTQFLPNTAHTVAICKEALHWMFTRTDCLSAVTKVPAHNRAALGMVRACRMGHEFDRPMAWDTGDGHVDVHFYAMRYWDWLKHATGIEERGQWFHARLRAEKIRMNSPEELHPDDPAHDRVVGAAIEQIFAGQIDKAIALYNHWARFAGYLPIMAEDIRSVNPLVIDIGGDTVLFGRDEIEVLSCRPLPQSGQQP